MQQSLKTYSLGLMLCFAALISAAQNSESVMGDGFSKQVQGSKSVQINEPAATVYVFLLETCPISQFYTLVLNDLYAQYKDQGIAFIGLFPNRASSAEKMDSFAAKYKVQFPLRLDYEKEFVNRFDATITPEVFVVEAASEQVLYKGRIDDSYFRVGKKRLQARSHDLKNTLKAITQGQPLVVTETEAIGCIINMSN